MTQLENTQDPVDLRSKLHSIVAADLLGPAGRLDETIPDQTIRDRYILGLFASKRQIPLPLEEVESLDFFNTNDETSNIDPVKVQRKTLTLSIFGGDFHI